MSLPVEILVVDDEAEHAEAMGEALTRVGYHVRIETSGQAAIAAVEEADFDILITDLVLGEVSGLDVLKRAREVVPDVAVIVISGRGGIEAAVEAMSQGAATYLAKPLNIDAVRQVVAQQAEKQALERRNIELERRLDEKYGFRGIIGKSPPMRRIFELLGQISPTNATVLITGESGTGKELIAKAIHQNSRRKHGPFVALNCAALSEGVLESELFGHVKGAFTGALRSHVGKFEFAAGGTLFLDEVGDMPISIQAKLLRVIEEREIVRVGSNDSIPIDVRLLAATNQDLMLLVREKQFREDLFFRLNVVAVELPSLRERRSDIPLIVDATMRELCQEYGKEITGIRADALDALTSNSWPGNVRELKNAVESAVIVARGPEITLEDLPSSLRRTGSEVRSEPDLVGMTISDMEQRLIERTLSEVEGNREQAAARLGISERTLYRKIKGYGIAE
jgi:two-component system, NtrC family, response regulator HydG